MKTDLATSILAAVLGVAVAFVVVNALIPAIEPVSFQKLDTTDMSYDLTEPDVDVFNYRALNPTVEVYVGDCDEYDDFGNCIVEDLDETLPENLPNDQDQGNQSSENQTPEDQIPENQDSTTPDNTAPEEGGTDGSSN